MAKLESKENEGRNQGRRIVKISEGRKSRSQDRENLGGRKGNFITSQGREYLQKSKKM
jgi:hypothetical protein